MDYHYPVSLAKLRITPDKTPTEYVYVNDFTGNVADVPKNSAKTTLSLLLPGKDTTIALPRLVSLRVYLSFGEQLFTNTSPDGNPTSPSAWSPDDPLQGGNYPKLWDYFELTWPRDNPTTTSLGANLTQLDFFGLALQLDNYGYKPDLKTPEHLKSGFEGNARSAILKAIKGLPEPWSKLVLPDLNPAFPGIPLRIFSPYHGMEVHLFPENQLETYIDRVWTYYARKKLLVRVSGGDYTGLVHTDGPNKGLFVFEPPTGSGLKPVVIKNPNTNSRVGFRSGSKDVYECQIQLDVVGPQPLSADARDIARDLAAGFLRSTLGQGVVNGVNLDVLPLCDQTGQYYTHEPINMYAAILHKHAILQKAYAFGYDDLCEQSSVGITKNPTKLVLTVHPLAS
ncbi:MAG TPA: beta-1,3-glucanase family protein [Bradyrhizobium sp.]|nr:beta-1,3-glucanase family protein [Bradyrhizobium sp.]